MTFGWRWNGLLEIPYSNSFIQKKFDDRETRKEWHYANNMAGILVIFLTICLKPFNLLD
jgi:hypothetical protein